MSSPVPQSLPDFYGALGADPMARLDQIEDLFRQLATEAETSGDHSRIPQAVEAFKVLRDPNMRQQYDQYYFQAVGAVSASQGQPPAQPPAAVAAPAPPPIAEVAPPVMQPTLEQIFQQPVQQPVSQPVQQPVSQPVQNVVQPTFEPPVEPVIATAAAAAAAVSAPPETATASPVEAQGETDDETEQSAVPEETAAQEVDNFDRPQGQKSSVQEELSLKPTVLERHRRELLRMFYEKRRKNMRASGMAIGGLDSIVSYSYELLEFHLWVLSEKKWIVREESGALSISALGCENHEKNLTEGLITSSL